MRKLLIVVDDDELVAAAIRLMLPDDWRLQELSHQQISNPILSKADVLLTDLHLTPNDQNKALGLEIIKKCKSQYPQLECIAMSGDLNMSLMEQGLASGAQYFLPKPISKDELLLILNRIGNFIDLKRRQQESSHKVNWIGSSQKSQDILKIISRIRDLPGHILIEGESGTGKEVVAQLLAKQSSNLSFVSINVSAIPSSLFESELFGHMKGSFTGADQNKIGLVEACQNGLLFLDEIEALDLHNQAKLLRFLESGEARRIGAKESYQSSARVIAATNVSLELLVEQGKFRQDLMFRLQQNKISLPPLRARLDELEELSLYFLSKLRPKINKSLSDEALQRLRSYHFPGNIRELKRIIEQAAFSAALPVIRPVDIEPLLLREQNESAPLAKQIHVYDSNMSLEQNLERVEKGFIEAMIQKHSDLENVWKELKISRSSLYKKIKDYGIKLP